MNTILLDKEKVENLFKIHTRQTDVLLDIYRMVFPEFDKVLRIERWPQVNNRTWKTIGQLFIGFDQKNHECILPGGLWLNRGFSSNNNLKDWEVSIEGVVITYKD